MKLQRIIVALAISAGAIHFAAGRGRAAPQEPPAAPQTPAAAPAQGYAGSEVCQACHDDVATHLADTPHGKAGFAKLSNLGCETCHGPAAAHAENPDDPALRPSFTKKSPAAQSQACQKCHDGREQFFWHG